MTSQEALSALRANLSALPERDQDFASSLISQSNRRGLSDKQMLWVFKLSERATGTEQPEAPVEVGSFAGVIGLFNTAKQHLKYPKIRLQTEDGRPVVLSIAGERAKRPGTVNVTDGGKFGENVWYGRVSQEGAWEKGGVVNAATETSVAALLSALASDPAGTAAKHGRLTGNCCFCNTGLCDERSTAMGYGPVCAKNYGLPWGSK